MKLNANVSFRPGTGVKYVTSICMGRGVRQFEKEVSFKLGTGVEYVTSNCMGRAVRQFEKEFSFRLGRGVEYVTSNCRGFTVRQFEKKLVLSEEREKYFLTDSFKKACDHLALQKMATAVSVLSRAQN